ncbi:MAG TPA: translation initiation factor IF-2 N-terminal domain-containing protein, partial [Flavipsychrobacter sp.]|nr:translation initiation factor IF-2 N-terminal domain-containing protein [Flavipsychrobacter sp.]
KPKKASKKEEPKIESKPAPEETESVHIEKKVPKLDGPNVLGKINLEEMNLSSRPKKGAAAKKAVKKKEEEPVAKAKPVEEIPPQQPVAEEKPKKAPKKGAEAKPVEAKKVEKPVDITPAKQPEVEDDKPEHIEMKAPKLEGPKIIGRIVLPVANRSSDSKEKRSRKRIPVQKKPENFKPDQQQGQGTQTNRDNRGGGERRPFGQQGQGQGGGQFRGGERRPFGQQGQGQGGQNRGGQQGQGGGAGKFDRNRRSQPQTQQQQEIDAKAIQEKIRQTQAKLAGNTRGKGKSKYRRNKREEMAERRAAEENEGGNIIQVTEFISVSELANLLNVSFADVISKCMGLGIMVSINQRLDAEVIELVSGEFGYEVEFINLEQEADVEEEEIDDSEELISRAPIVTIMGHVDHGKTSLLDYVRSANVVAGEAGGITQHIGAYQVTTADGKKITFLDTPGHEAFTAMRARGAKVADIAIIVVAADDAIMPQTKEAISHAQAANLPMVFAINKIDKEGANPEKIKEQLAGMNILVEDWGGKFQSQEISAKKGLNIDLLLEKIALEAELLELKANPDRTGTGSVIEASLDKGRGYQATILVQNGTLEQGDM